MTPGVSILLSVHRDRGGLRRTVEQVLDQSRGDLELIAIDDGARDATPDVLAELAAEDDRVRVLTNPGNLGLTASLNRGLQVSRAPWIARIDEGDGWHPEKLAEQLARLEAEPSLVLLGSQADFVDAATGARLPSPRLPLEDAALRSALLAARNPFIHSSVVFRRLRGVRYNAGPWAADRAMDTISDYELWLRLSLVGRLENLSRSLVTFAWAGGHQGLTTDRAPQQFDLKRRLHASFLSALARDPAATIREGLDPGPSPPSAPSRRRRLSFDLRYRAVSASTWRGRIWRAAGYALDPRDLAFHLWSKGWLPLRQPLWPWSQELRRQLEECD